MESAKKEKQNKSERTSNLVQSEESLRSVRWVREGPKPLAKPSRSLSVMMKLTLIRHSLYR